jgi:hypothetical protein
VTPKDQRNANGAARSKNFSPTSNLGFGSDESGVRLEESERVFMEFIDVSRIRILVLRGKMSAFLGDGAVHQQHIAEPNQTRTSLRINI